MFTCQLIYPFILALEPTIRGICFITLVLIDNLDVACDLCQNFTRGSILVFHLTVAFYGLEPIV
jgi:hypothetical protein